MGNQPVWKSRAGAVTCALWENEATINGRSVKMLKASVERRFKAADGTWQSSGSFSRNEIPMAIFCLARAFDKIITEEQQADRPGEETLN